MIDPDLVQRLHQGHLAGLWDEEEQTEGDQINGGYQAEGEQRPLVLRETKKKDISGGG